MTMMQLRPPISSRDLPSLLAASRFSIFSLGGVISASYLRHMPLLHLGAIVIETSTRHMIVLRRFPSRTLTWMMEATGKSEHLRDTEGDGGISACVSEIATRTQFDR